jgi:RNA polymerase sigma factor (sigma-70 family)
MTEAELSVALHRAQSGDRAAFDDLCAGYQRALFGAIRARVSRDDDAHDVLQEAWLLIWQKLPTYEPARASFRAFARYWAGIAVLRYYDAQKASRTGEVVASELAARFPKLAEEEGVAAVLDRLAARPPEPEDPVRDEAAYATLLRITFETASPPHQLLAFGFSKLIGWPPREIAARRSSHPLRQLETELQSGYLAQSQLRPAQVEPSFAPLHGRLELPFEAVAASPRTLATYPQLRGRLAGDTTLQDYYTSPDPATDLSAWWFAVQRRVRSEIQRRGGLAAATDQLANPVPPPAGGPVRE